jgi:T5SS/PEP-CTERM-associated repeat protein
MKNHFVLTCFFLVNALSAYAGTDSWVPATNGLWRTAVNWSSSQVPSTSFDPTIIANAGTKTVTVDAATPVANLSVRTLSISAPGGSINTLLLDSLPSAFITGRPFTIGSGGVVRVTNSTLSVLDTFDITAGNLTLDSGTIDTTPNLVDVRVGRASGATGTVTLNGGILRCFGFRIGELAGSQGVCTISGGTLFSTSVVDMGELLNSPGTLNIVSGQLIATNDITRVGNLAPGTLNQSGGSSQLSFLSIGDNASGTMNFSGGSLVVTPNSDLDVTRVGNFADSQLNISGGTVWLRGDFHVADNPGINATVTLSGGTLTATNGLVAIGRYGIGLMTVTNATAWLTNASVGRHTGATGTFNLQDGGSVSCVDDLSIGRFVDAVGHVTVSGGLLSLTNDNIWVGRDGIGDLTISAGRIRSKSMFVGMSEFGTNAPQGNATFNGGITTVSSRLIIGSSLISTGQVNMSGGVLAVTNTLANGTIDVDSGKFSLTGGTLLADALVVTNSSTQMNFSSGTLQLGSLSVSNGLPFIVGDGVNPAVLQLQGGTYFFADSLVISSNATVTGCGTIIGATMNNGTLNLTCVQSTPVLISSIARSGNTATVSFSTTAGKTHLLEYKNALIDPAWTTILPGVVGNGTVTNLLDAAATNTTRFYRIRIQ